MGDHRPDIPEVHRPALCSPFRPHRLGDQARSCTIGDLRLTSRGDDIPATACRTECQTAALASLIPEPVAAAALSIKPVMVGRGYVGSSAQIH